MPGHVPCPQWCLEGLPGWLPMHVLGNLFVALHPGRSPAPKRFGGGGSFPDVGPACLKRCLEMSLDNYCATVSEKVSLGQFEHIGHATVRIEGASAWWLLVDHWPTALGWHFRLHCGVLHHVAHRTLELHTHFSSSIVRPIGRNVLRPFLVLVLVSLQWFVELLLSQPGGSCVSCRLRMSVPIGASISPPPVLQRFHVINSPPVVLGLFDGLFTPSELRRPSHQLFQNLRARGPCENWPPHLPNSTNVKGVSVRVPSRSSSHTLWLSSTFRPNVEVDVPMSPWHSIAGACWFLPLSSVVPLRKNVSFLPSLVQSVGERSCCHSAGLCNWCPVFHLWGSRPLSTPRQRCGDSCRLRVRFASCLGCCVRVGPQPNPQS